jgi:hypothetical protein
MKSWLHTDYGTPKSRAALVSIKHSQRRLMRDEYVCTFGDGAIELFTYGFVAYSESPALEPGNG